MRLEVNGGYVILVILSVVLTFSLVITYILDKLSMWCGIDINSKTIEVVSITITILLFIIILLTSKTSVS